MEPLEAARAGDETAFDALAAPHRRELLAYCSRVLGSAEDAEDAFQETLLAAWRGLDGFQRRSSLRTWLYRVACHCWLRLADKRPKRARQAVCARGRPRRAESASARSRGTWTASPVGTADQIGFASGGSGRCRIHSAVRTRCRWARTLAMLPHERPSGPPAVIRHQRLPALRVWS
jgi:hypothetical protein